MISERDILYEDNHLLIINKKAGWLSQSDITGDDSVVDMAKDFIKHKYNKPGNVFIGLAHRLDRPVSGVLVLCKTSKALTRMTKIFKERELNKVYHAICINRPKTTEAQLIHYIAKDKTKNKIKFSKQAFPNGKKAVLNYHVLRHLDGNKSLIEVNLETGRPHQIRIQLSDIQCPILGDLRYSKQNPLSDKSIALHSRKLTFIHPVKKEPLELIAPYPKSSWWKL